MELPKEIWSEITWYLEPVDCWSLSLSSKIIQHHLEAITPVLDRWLLNDITNRHLSRAEWFIDRFQLPWPSNLYRHSHPEIRRWLLKHNYPGISLYEEQMGLLRRWIHSVSSSDDLFDSLIQKIDDHYASSSSSFSAMKEKSKKNKGELFERLSLEMILTGKMPHFKGVKDGWLFKEVPDKIRKSLSLGTRDMGIDIVVLMDDGSWRSVQVKYRKKPNKKFITKSGYPKAWKVTWQDLSTFYALCERTHPPNGWDKLVVITNCEGVNRAGRKNAKDLSICQGAFRSIPKEVWFEVAGDIGHKMTDGVVIEKSPQPTDLRAKRLAWLDKL